MAPCPDCVEDAQHRDEHMAIVWCQHRKAGGVYTVDSGIWKISFPHATEKEFRRSLYAEWGRKLMQKSV
jgi:hypothetical protein